MFNTFRTPTNIFVQKFGKMALGTQVSTHALVLFWYYGVVRSISLDRLDGISFLYVLYGIPNTTYEPMYKPIRDYAIIGNLRSCALVGMDGSIDWAPAPYIDSPSAFGAILDHDKGGHFSVRPTVPYKSQQYYLENSNVLVTRFMTQSGVVEVTDFIPIEPERTFVPAEEDTTFKIKRKVKCVEGQVPLRVEFKPRFDYGRGRTELSYINRGILAQNNNKRGILVSTKEYDIDDEQGLASTEFTLVSGRFTYLVFRYNTGVVDLKKDDEDHHNEDLKRTIGNWQEWVEKCDIENVTMLRTRWQEQIDRSALLLKILFFEPVGTIAAAATTSLPEWIGGVRNWDYRYTWIRDSSYAFKALFGIGHSREAEEYLNWLVNLCATSEPSAMRIMYGLRGETDLTEEILPHLEGYEGSKPVRIGNGAADQRQWDIYGSVFDVAYTLYELTGETVDEKHWEVLAKIADHVVNVWQEPDEGIWEVRGGADHFLYSKIMCWVALDRAVKMCEKFDLSCDRNRWMSERDKIYHEIMTRGWNEEKQAFTQSFDSDYLDAVILLMPTTGIIEGNDPRMVSTIRAIQKELGRGDDGSLLLRYDSDDGLPGEEGVFLLTSFWLVDALVLADQVEEATNLFEKLVSYANHVGLYAEEMDPGSKAFLGNFPQAYTHIGLINSALLLGRHGVGLMEEEPKEEEVVRPRL